MQSTKEIPGQGYKGKRIKKQKQTNKQPAVAPKRIRDSLLWSHGQTVIQNNE